MSARTLRAQARAAAKYRGHDLAPFRLIRGHPWPIWSAQCRAPGCDAVAEVDPRPRANGIDIAGRAVALDCPSRHLAGGS